MLSRRQFMMVGLLGFISAAAAACAAAVGSSGPSSSSRPPSPSLTPGSTPSPSPAGAALRDRIGQMLVVGFRGATPEEAEPVRRLVADGTLGGVLLFSVDQQSGGPRNVDSPEQLAGLITALAEEAATVPLLVAIDQEGGQVARLGPAHGFPPTRSAAELGGGDPSETAAAAAEIASTLAAVGVTLNLAPVVDLAINPDNPIIAGIDRSFSADPAAVTAHAGAFIEAHRAAGIRTAIKHFPGQGSASADTHLGVVDVTDEWSDVELEPFRALIGQQLSDAVLTAHIFNARLDPAHPASLSAATADGLLRADLGFGGAVISDDLQMGAIRDAYGFDEAVALAIEAGVDLLLIANQAVYEPDVAMRAVDLVERLIREGRISEARIDASYRRILELKGVA
jgi:beta-N-acetylhexosaminidase